MSELFPTRETYVSVMTRDSETNEFFDRWTIWITATEPSPRTLYGPLPIPLSGSIAAGLALIEKGISIFGYVRSGDWEERPSGWVAWVTLDEALFATLMVDELENDLRIAARARPKWVSNDPR